MLYYKLWAILIITFSTTIELSQASPFVTKDYSLTQDKKLPGIATSDPIQSTGEYWVQVYASRKMITPTNILGKYSYNKAVIHKDSNNLYRLLVGPISNFDNATKIKTLLISNGIKEAFIRFSSTIKKLACAKPIIEKSSVEYISEEKNNFEVMLITINGYLEKKNILQLDKVKYLRQSRRLEFVNRSKRVGL